MPAAAVIPAPIAYINVVAVKKLVVGFLMGALVTLTSVLMWRPVVSWGCLLVLSYRLVDPCRLL